MIFVLSVTIFGFGSNKMKSKYLGFMLLSGFMLTSASAEVLLIERTQQQNNQPMPKHGQSMQQVETQFGQPLVRRAAVGEPPITRWEYADYVVYFEHNLVLNSVLKHTTKQP